MTTPRNPTIRLLTDAGVEQLRREMAEGWDRFNWDQHVAGEGWGLFNRDNPLSCGIEACTESGVFTDDEEAYQYVSAQARAGSPYHMAAEMIHLACNELRWRAWGCPDRRTPPETTESAGAG